MKPVYLRNKKLSSANEIKSNSTTMERISRIYGVNIVMKNIRDVFGNRPCFRDISYDLIRELGHNNNSVTHSYDTALKEKMRVIWILQKEITVIQRLIQVNVRKYERVDEKDIKALDQAYAKIDRTVKYTRRVIIKLPYIIERILRVALMKKYRNGLKVRKREGIIGRFVQGVYRRY